MKVIEAGVFDIQKINHIIVDDRSMFDSPIFARGAEPAYSTWSGFKPLAKFLITVLHPRKRLFFALEEKNVIGVAVINNRNFIDGFFINKEYRGKGLGAKLMDHVCSKVIKGSGSIHVGVQSINESAIRFYKKYGFEIKEYVLKKELR